MTNLGMSPLSLRAAIAVLASLVALSPFAPAGASAVAAPVAPTLVSPVADAVVPSNPDGIEVTFTCPGFSTAEFDYGNFAVEFNTTGETRADGTLKAGVGMGTTDVSFDGASTCRATFKTTLYGAEGFDHYLRTEVSGGSVFWQARGFDADPNTAPAYSGIGRFTVAQPSAGTISVPRRVYAGYSAALSYRTDAEVYGAPATLERFDGTSWTPLGAGEFQGGWVRYFVSLPAGPSALRVTLGLPSAPLSTDVVNVDVRAGGKRLTNRRDNGSYRVRGHSGDTLFAARGKAHVVKKGRVIKNLSLKTQGLCVSLSGAADSRTRLKIPRVPVAPDGSFAFKTVDEASGTASEVFGRLRSGRMTVNIDLSKPGCTTVGTVRLRRR